jgi:hypothetical protein
VRISLRAAAATLVCAAGLAGIAGCSQAQARDDGAGAQDAGLERADDPSAHVDIAALQDEVAAQLHDQVGGRWTVACPPDQPAAMGTSFTCDVVDRGGLSASVAVTITDAAGGFSWHTDDQPTSVRRATDTRPR